VKSLREPELWNIKPFNCQRVSCKLHCFFSQGETSCGRCSETNAVVLVELAFVSGPACEFWGYSMLCKQTGEQSGTLNV